jgi:hypothetical protein
VCNYAGSVDRGNANAAMAGSSVSSVSTNPPEELTIDNVREMSAAKLNLLKKAQFLRAELKELKEAIFVVDDATGANAYGDVPVGLTQVNWDTENRTVIGWDAIHKLAAEQTAEQTPNDGAKRGAVNTVVNGTSVEEDNTSSEAKLAKLAKRVKLAKSMALWCLSPNTPLRQDAKDK